MHSQEVHRRRETKRYRVNRDTAYYLEESATALQEAIRLQEQASKTFDRPSALNRVSQRTARLTVALEQVSAVLTEVK